MAYSRHTTATTAPHGSHTHASLHDITSPPPWASSAAIAIAQIRHVVCRLHRVSRTSSLARPYSLHREALPQRHISSLQINVLQTTDGADRTLARKQSALPPPARSSRPHVMLPCWIVLRCWSVGVVSLFCWICTARHDTTVKTRLVLMSTTIDRKWKLHVPVPRKGFHHIDGNSGLLATDLYRHALLTRWRSLPNFPCLRLDPGDGE